MTAEVEEVRAFDAHCHACGLALDVVLDKGTAERWEAQHNELYHNHIEDHDG